MTLQSIIARLEAATGPDRELDRDIAEISGWERKVTSLNEDDYWRFGDMSWTRECEGYPPRYTASIDAALTLVPEGWTRDVDATEPESLIDVRLHRPGIGAGSVLGIHATEAVATCIAALKARLS